MDVGIDRITTPEPPAPERFVPPAFPAPPPPPPVFTVPEVPLEATVP